MQTQSDFRSASDRAAARGRPWDPSPGWGSPDPRAWNNRMGPGPARGPAYGRIDASRGRVVPVPGASPPGRYAAPSWGQGPQPGNSAAIARERAEAARAAEAAAKQAEVVAKEAARKAQEEAAVASEVARAEEAAALAREEEVKKLEAEAKMARELAAASAQAAAADDARAREAESAAEAAMAARRLNNAPINYEPNQPAYESRRQGWGDFEPMRQPARAWGNNEPYPPPKRPPPGELYDMPHSARDRAMRRNGPMPYERMMMDDGWCGPGECW